MRVLVKKKRFNENCEYKLMHAVIVKNIEKNLQTLQLSSKCILKEKKERKKD